MLLSAPRAILFDWDNTLVDTWPIIHAALNMTLRYMNHPEWPIERVRKEVKKSMRDAFPTMFGTRWEEAADHYQQSYRSMHLQYLKPIPGAQALLTKLAEATPLGVVSNKKGDSLRKEITHLGWDHFFGPKIGAGDAKRDKPHPDPALMALEQMQLPPSPAIWFVGDTSVDLDCANAAGLTAIWYGDHDPEIHAKNTDRYHVHVKDFDQLLALLTSPREAA